MAASDATPFPIKNQAYRVTFPILDADGDLVTGASGLDSEVSKDGGTFADCTSEATEIATSSGVYYLDLTSTEMNADTVAIIVKSSTSGAKTTTIVLYPITNGLDIPVNATYCGGTSLTGRDIGASVLLSSGTGTGQLDFTSGVVKSNVTQFGGSAGTFSSGRPEVNTTHAAGTAWASGAITAAVLAADAITAAKVASDVGTEIATAVWGAGTRQLTGTQTFDLTGNITGALSGSVGSVTGNVGGNVTGSVGSVAAGGITASSIATDAIGAAEIAADAIAEIAAGVWDLTLSGHTSSGTTGEALNAAGAAGDPWTTALPGAYGSGSAGYIVGNNLDVASSSRLASASYTAPLDAAGVRTAVGMASANLDTQLGNINTKTTNLPAAPAATGDIPSASSIASAVLTTQLADVYAANGVAPTTQQALMAVHQYLMAKAVQGLDLTVYKLDGSTEAFVVTLDDDTAPTSGIRE